MKLLATIGTQTAAAAGGARRQDHRPGLRLVLRARPRVLMLAVAILLAGAMPAAAQNAIDKKPYDKQLLRLSELLGAVHYLRELCGAGDGLIWRQQMQSLIKSEGTSALRRLQLTRKFNFGYHSYSRTYHRCTPSAKTAISRFLNEAAVISDSMAYNIK